MRMNRSLSRCSSGDSSPTQYSTKASATNAAKIQPSVWMRPLNTRRVYQAPSNRRSGNLSTDALRQSEVLPDNRSRSGLVERVEMQSGCTAAQQVIAQLRHDIQTERADRRRVVPEAFEL